MIKFESAADGEIAELPTSREAGLEGSISLERSGTLVAILGDEHVDARIERRQRADERLLHQGMIVDGENNYRRA